MLATSSEAVNVGRVVDPGWRTTITSADPIEIPATVEDLAVFMLDPCPPTIDTPEYKSIERTIAASTLAGIEYMDREMLPREMVQRMDVYPREHSGRGALGRFVGAESPWIRIPRVPVIELTAVRIFDTSGDMEELTPDDYEVDEVSEPARLKLMAPPGRFSLAEFAGIRIEYQAGYPDDTLPAPIKEGVIAHAAYMIEQRGHDVRGAIEKSGAAAYWSPYRMWTGL